MTDRHTAYIVILQNPIREDDADATIMALNMVKGVLTVEPVVEDVTHVVATARAEHDLGQRILKAVYGEIRKTN